MKCFVVMINTLLLTIHYYEKIDMIKYCHCCHIIMLQLDCDKFVSSFLQIASVRKTSYQCLYPV